jgi:hypothetical protein
MLLGASLSLDAAQMNTCAATVWWQTINGLARGEKMDFRLPGTRLFLFVSADMHATVGEKHGWLH